MSASPVPLPFADHPPLHLRLRLWQDFIPAPLPPQNEIQPIATLLAGQYAAQKGRDSSAYMQPFWKSPLVAWFTAESVAIGWDQVKTSVERAFADRPARVYPVLERLRTDRLDAQTALTVEWWTFIFPLRKIRGFTSSTWHKFPHGWRIIQAQTDATGLR